MTGANKPYHCAHRYTHPALCYPISLETSLLYFPKIRHPNRRLPNDQMLRGTVGQVNTPAKEFHRLAPEAQISIKKENTR